MPNIIFASNSIGHFPGTTLRSESWAYDSNRVPYAIEPAMGTPATSPKLAQSATDETWFHLRHTPNDVWDSENRPIFEVVNENGQRVCQVYHRNSTTGYNINGTIDGQGFSVSRWVPMLIKRMRTYDLMIRQTAVQATVRLYVNEILINEATFAISTRETLDVLWIGGEQGSNNNPTYSSAFSEIIIADGDTRNARLDLLRPVAAGAYSNWQGLLSSLSDDDPTTGMTTTLPNQTQSTVLEPYTGANNISNVVQITTAVRGINSPENLQHLLRSGGVDYLTPNFAIPNTKAFQITDYRENPATTAPWEASDLVGMEFGFRSIA